MSGIIAVVARVGPVPVIATILVVIAPVVIAVTAVVIAAAIAAGRRAAGGERGRGGERQDHELVHRHHSIWSRAGPGGRGMRSEEHTSELQSLMRISYAVFCLKKKIVEEDEKI